MRVTPRPCSRGGEDCRRGRRRRRDRRGGRSRAPLRPPRARARSARRGGNGAACRGVAGDPPPPRPTAARGAAARGARAADARKQARRPTRPVRPAGSRRSHAPSPQGTDPEIPRPTNAPAGSCSAVHPGRAARAGRSASRHRRGCCDRQAQSVTVRVVQMAHRPTEPRLVAVRQAGVRGHQHVAGAKVERQVGALAIQSSVRVPGVGHRPSHDHRERLSALGYEEPRPEVGRLLRAHRHQHEAFLRKRLFRLLRRVELRSVAAARHREQHRDRCSPAQNTHAWRSTRGRARASLRRRSAAAPSRARPRARRSRA